jgi:hypothetical protein
MHSHGCVDGKVTLKNALQSVKHGKLEAYVLAASLVKAFDIFNREIMWQILVKYGLPERPVNVIMEVYADIKVLTSVGKTNATFYRRWE